MNIFRFFPPKFRLHYSLILLISITVWGLSACTQSQPTAELFAPPAADFTATPKIETFIPLIELEVAPTETPLPTADLPPTATPLPNPPPEPIGGIELHKIADDGGLALLADTHTYWIRKNGLFWADIEPNEGVQNWESAAQLEVELQTAAEQGYEVILIIRNSPAWARTVPDYHCSAIPPEKLNAFADFMRAAVTRYSAPPYNVKFWELGNEPDVAPEQVHPSMPFGCWGNLQDAYFGGGYYAEMLKAVYPAIKAADPNAQVVLGGLLMGCDPLTPPETSPGSGEYADCTSSKFLEGILKNGGGDYFDGVSFHSYDYYMGEFPIYGNSNWHSSWDTTGPSMIAKAAYLRSLLGIYNYPNKFLMNTETALLCGQDGTEPACQTDEFDQTKANLAAQSFAAARAAGLRANIWYSITGWRGSGLVTPDMLPTYASRGYAFSLKMLENAAYVDQITAYPGVQGYKFWRNGQAIWVIWGLQDAPQTITLPTTPQASYDLYGNPLPANQTLEITPGTIYLEFAP